MTNDIKKILSRYFFLITLFVIVIFMLFSVFFFYSKEEALEKENTENIVNIINFLDATQEKSKKIIDDLYKNNLFRENFSAYLTMPVNEYVANNLLKGLPSQYIEETFQNLMNSSSELVGVTVYFDNERLFKLQRKPKTHALLVSKNANYLLEKQEEYKGLSFYFYYDLSPLSSKMSETFFYSIRNIDNDVDLPSQNYQLSNHDYFKQGETVKYLNSNILVYKNANPSSLFQIVGIAILVALIFLIVIWLSLQLSFRKYLEQYNIIVSHLRENASQTTDFKQIEVLDKEGDLQKIADEINKSVKKREDLIKTEYENLLLRERVELSNLQHQIDPHFLFNNLEFIRMKAFLKKDYEVSQFIFEVSRLYRESLSKSSVITLQEEIQMIENYLTIYKIRWEERFSYKVISNIQTLKIPKFALQPFVENYIKYGMRPDKKNYLVVKCIETDNHFIFSFIDNGGGASSETIDKIYRRIECSNKSEKNIGIANSIKRLKLFYKTEVQYQIKNIPNQGFFVKIIIEKEQVDEANEKSSHN